MHGTGYAEGHVHVHLGERVRLVRTCILKISQRTGINHVTNLESLDGLILGNTSSASVTYLKCSDASSVASVTSVISSLNGHVLFCVVVCVFSDGDGDDDVVSCVDDVDL